jgi:gamma-glutamylcyclotransferase (GGCT)/AIG2-like uncharacterized protein YtfP
MKKCLFYGTLRKNGPAKKVYNFNRFKGQTFIKNWYLSGVSLFNLGYYPCVIWNGNKKIETTLIRKHKNQVLCELHNVEDESFEKISKMEESAGYSVLELENCGEKVYLFCYPPDDKIDTSKLEKIESGDWCKD